MDLSHLKPLIENGTIDFFGQLFDHVTVIDLSKAMQCSATHTRYIRDLPTYMTLMECFNLAEAIGVERRVIMGLVERQPD